MNDLLDRVIDGKYRLVRLIGEGGMGAVYEAQHIRLQRKFAIKTMHPDKGSPHSSMERFHREALAASAIGHPNIVEVFDVGVEEQDGLAFIVMELLKGVSLAAMLRIEGKLAVARAITIALQVLSALNAAHRKGIVHRDLKPDNVFISVDPLMREVVKVLDFGVAKFQRVPTKDMELTQSGVVFGSPYYLAPEQARGRKDIDARIDIWAVGVLLYCMLTGHRPFEGKGYNEILGKILMDEPSPIAEANPDAPAELEAIVAKAMCKDRDDRFSSAIEMLDALMPLHDPTEDEMNTGVFQVLHQRFSSVPPLVDPRFQVQIPEGGAAPVTYRGSDPLAQTMPTGSGAEAVPPAGLGRTALIAGGVALALCLVIGGLVIFTARESVVGGVPVGLAGSERSDQLDQPSPAEQTIRPDRSETADQSETSGRSELSDLQDASPEQVIPEQVTIEIAGLPRKSVVTLDGRKVKLPIVLPGSDKPVLLKVRAKGHAPFLRALIPDRDQEIDVGMAATEAPAPEKKPGSEKKPGPAKKRPAKKRPAQPKPADDWADNPFKK